MQPNVESKKSHGAKNACKVCAPLGAALVYAGLKRTITIMHGSQGCSTYIRRYMISHFREPLDIASSSFGEEEAVFGGKESLRVGLENITTQYQPDLIGVCTTCLSETIGEDMDGIIKDIKRECEGLELPPIVHVSTPSYKHTHVEGFHHTMRALCEQYAKSGERQHLLNVMPGMVSPEDLRYIKQLLKDAGIPMALLTDYSETLDGGNWARYEKVPKGGTSLETLASSANAMASLELGRVLAENKKTAGTHLQERFAVAAMRLGFPMGLRETDTMLEQLVSFFDVEPPPHWEEERSRLIDAYVDAHKYFFGHRAAVFGDPDLVVGMVSFLDEIGIQPVIVATGTYCDDFEAILAEVMTHYDVGDVEIMTGVDHTQIEERLSALNPTMLIGNSKGFPMSKALNIPLYRVGFPIHDRFGAQRIQHFGYKGALNLLDGITNLLIENSQRESEVGYFYM